MNRQWFVIWREENKSGTPTTVVGLRGFGSVDEASRFMRDAISEDVDRTLENCGWIKVSKDYENYYNAITETADQTCYYTITTED